MDIIPYFPHFLGKWPKMDFLNFLQPQSSTTTHFFFFLFRICNIGLLEYLYILSVSNLPVWNHVWPSLSSFLALTYQTGLLFTHSMCIYIQNIFSGSQKMASQSKNIKIMSVRFPGQTVKCLAFLCMVMLKHTDELCVSENLLLLLWLLSLTVSQMKNSDFAFQRKY